MKFDPSFDPPAPIATVVIRNQETGEISSRIGMLVDTGADISLIPAPDLEAMGIRSTAESKIDLIGFEGKEMSFAIVETQILFAKKRFTGNYCVIDSGLGILGRDVLNQLILVLDGPALEWTATGSEDIQLSS